MLFYIILAGSCVVVAVVFLWLFRSLTSASTGFGHGLLPSLNWLSGRRRRAQRLSHLNQGLDATSPVPWGWERGRTTSSARTQPGTPAAKTPWGWGGNGRREDGALLGWPHRRPKLAGSSKRQSGFAGNGKKSGKPWGW